MSVRVIFLEKNPDEESINYYFSKDPMNPDNMPAPISTSGPSESLTSEPNYGSDAVGWTVDWDREEDAYVRVGVVKNGIESLSNEWVYSGYQGISIAPWFELTVLPMPSEISFSPDYRFFAIVSSNKLNVIEWETYTPISIDEDISSDVNCFDFSYDSKFMVLGRGVSPRIVVLDTSTWSVISTTDEAKGSVSSVSFSPNSDYISATTLWAGETPFYLFSYPDFTNFLVPHSEISSTGRKTKFSPDGEYVLYVDVSNVYVKYIHDYHMKKIESANFVGTRSIDITSDSKYLAIARDRSPYLYILDTEDFSLVSTPSEVNSSVSDVSFSNDSKFLCLAVSSSPRFYVLDTSNWESVDTGLSFPGSGKSCCFSPDSKNLLMGHSGSSNRNFTMANTSSWNRHGHFFELSILFDNSNSVLSFSNDSKVLAVADGSDNKLTILESGSWSKLKIKEGVFSGTCNSCSFSPDDSLIAVSHSSGSRFTLLSYPDLNEVQFPTVDGVSRDSEFSPCGYYLAIARNSGSFLTIVNSSDFSLVEDQPQLPDRCSSLSFSADGSLLACCYESYPYISVYNTEDWSLIPSVGSVEDAKLVSFSPCGNYLAVSAENGSITVIDPRSWEVYSGPSGIENYFSTANCLSFSSDGRYLHLGGWIREVVINTDDWSYFTPKRAGNHIYFDSDFSSDGKYLANTTNATPSVSVITSG